ncbi:MAG: response regulator transcription factor [Planctomycetales bacterium]|nr:response regulator transcription factor [Planctomycetales bacterium]
MNDQQVSLDSDRASRGGDPVRVLIVHDRALVRDGLRLIFATDANLQLVAALASLSEVTNDVAPDVALLASGLDGNLAAEVAELQSKLPRAKIVLLDDVANDGRVVIALRTDARGYLTARQSGDDVISAVRRAAVGERVFTPEIAARLTVTPEGLRLRRSVDEGPLAGLTPREREVMTYLSLGYTVKQTAATLGLQPSTVDNHKTRLMKKLDAHKTVELTRLAFRYGLVTSDGPSPGQAEQGSESDAAR